MVMKTEGEPVGRKNCRSRLARQLAASWARVVRECAIKREGSVRHFIEYLAVPHRLHTSRKRSIVKSTLAKRLAVAFRIISCVDHSP